MSAARRYTGIAADVAVGFLSCPDCAAVVWHTGRDSHDAWHDALVPVLPPVLALAQGATTCPRCGLLHRGECW